MEAVASTLNYLVAQRDPVHTYAYDPPDGSPRFNASLRPYPVRIADARQLAADPGPVGWVHGRGFTLLRQRWPTAALDDSDGPRRLYAQAEELLCALSGAAHARVFDHTVRRRAAGPRGRAGLDGVGGSFAQVREPVGRVHVDYTPYSAPLRLRQALGEAQAERVLAGRWLILGMWRPLLPEPLLDAPLALADARSLRAAELVTNDLIYAERRGQTYAVLHDESHLWYYYPELTRDEAAVFVHYDSERALGPCTGACAHSAFEHPATPADAPARHSLELRAFAWYD